MFIWNRWDLNPFWRYHSRCYNGVVEVKRKPRLQDIEDRSPVATDVISLKNIYWQLHCQTLRNGCVTVPRRWPLLRVGPCYSRCVTLENPFSSMAMHAEHRSAFAALHWQWWRRNISVNSHVHGTINSKQTKHVTIVNQNSIPPSLSQSIDCIW